MVELGDIAVAPAPKSEPLRRITREASSPSADLKVRANNLRKASGGSAENLLDAIVALDQGQRKTLDPKKIDRDLDRKNREEVQRMIDSSGLTSPDDYRKAALVFQHGETPEDFLKAFDLSTKSAELGMPPFATTLAQSFDRLMLTLQQTKGVPDAVIKQRFGTQQRHGGNYYNLDGFRTEEDAELFSPNLEGFSEKTPEEQQSAYSRLQQQWENSSREDRRRSLDRMKEDLSRVRQAYRE